MKISITHKTSKQLYKKEGQNGDKEEKSWINWSQNMKNTGHRTQHYSYWFDIRNLLGLEDLIDLDLNFDLAFS